MALVFNGSSNTIGGLAVGGVPDGTIDEDALAAGVGGKILQVVQSTNNDARSSTSTSYVDITGTDETGSGSILNVI